MRAEVGLERVQVDSGSGESGAAFLFRVGERLRLLRARRGMSRRALARQSSVSERHIAQLEAGAGNISLLLLHRLAVALGEPVWRLVAPERAAGGPGDGVLSRLIERLSEEQMEAARRLLLDHFSPPGSGVRRERVALIGLRGAGKSTLGAALAQARGVPFRELDREVERLSRMELRDIFEVQGQEGFRQWERQALQSVVEAEPRVVIAAGGGLVAEPATLDLLLTHCLTVWVKASPEEHMGRVVAQGDQRPMADDRARAMDDLRAILQSREKLYAQADLVLDTTGRTMEASLSDLVALLEGGARDSARGDAAVDLI